MLFNYQATSSDGKLQEGVIDAISRDVALGALQRRGLVVVEVVSITEKKWYEISLFTRVKAKDLVVLSRQLSTLFEAKVSVLDSFRLLARESSSPSLKETLSMVSDDIQAGFQISKAMEKHPDVFSEFYVNMIAAGEESGRLPETFTYLADYLERQYELISKAKHAMVYPAFVIMAFLGVMIIMFTVVIPKLSEIIQQTGGDVPLYTRIVIGTSNFFVNYGIFVAVLVVVGTLFLWRYSITQEGKELIDRSKLTAPLVGDLFRKFYLSRISDNLDTLLSSGVSMLKALEVTSRVVGSVTYKHILEDSMEGIRAGGTLSSALLNYRDYVPAILVQMLRIGEETGRLGFVLGTIARFYKREVEGAIETLVSLIEPIMIIVLGIGVGILLTSVLLPIYNLAGSIA